jgi:glycosyltransferase involved in cell wall biosynthesis
LIVAVDTLFLLKQFRRTGTGVYLYNVLTECLKIAKAGEWNYEFHGFMAPDDNWAENGLVSPFLHVHGSRILTRKGFWRLGGMAVSTSLVRPDLVFLPTAQGSIPGPFAPLVSTILDAIPQRVPRELVEGGKRAHYMTWISAKLASRVITISEWSKRDLVEIYGLDPARVDVTYLGYDKKVLNEAPPDAGASTALLKRFGIRRPFILHHGMVQLRKNVHRLIRAWDRVMEHSRSFDAQLVLAGPLGYRHEEILRVREGSPNRDQVILTGAFTDTELATLVKNASLCVIPSLYEGFCLPMVEAMACGVPTVASNSSCIPEVSGGVLEYFDPLSVEEMAEVIRRALEDSDLRERLRDRGLARAAEFSWERCARETLRIFIGTVAEHGRKSSTASPS